jgi:uncharacterized protein (DUF1015 family)
MSVLFPFRALRPTPEVAARVAAVPYDVVTAAEARAIAAGNPLSFLHVSRAEIDLPPDTDPYSDAVYARAAENFARLRAAAPLVVEDAPSVYVYRLQAGTHVQTGVAGCFSLDEYDGNAIRKHEQTRRDKEDDRTRHLIALRAQTGPVFLVYRTSLRVNQVVARAVGDRPLFDFEADDGVRHSVWRLGSDDARQLVEAFVGVHALYIADGHHRAASAARARAHFRGSAGQRGEWDTFLAVAFPDAEVQILPYNRVVKTLDGLTPEQFLARLREEFVLEAGPPVPERRGDVSVFVEGRWYTLALGGAPPHLPAAERLDVSRLQDRVLGPLLGIRDPRSDQRLEFSGGSRGPAALEEAVATGRAAVAFSMYPVSVEDLMTIADAGGVMPPKSTWFEPKLRDGLLSHLIEEP